MIDVLLPCRDESATIAGVVADFAAQGARVLVCDNASTDDTAARAAAAGAEVFVERRPGKGWALRRLLAEIRGEVVVLADGDGTYPAALPALEAALAGGADMVVGRRVAAAGALSPVRRAGNLLFSQAFALGFGAPVHDLLSGCRAFPAGRARELHLREPGFTVEAEIAVFAARAGWRITEVELPYRPRPPGSHSKLRAGPDGARILGLLAREWLRG